MSDYYDIQIRITRGGIKSPRGGTPQRHDWECPYCHGSGVDPYGIMGNEECSACLGARYWTANISYDKLYVCDTCKGSGAVEDCGFVKPCPDCRGSGRLKD